MEVSLPSIPSKRYFTIGEVAELCAVKPHVLRYWEQEFAQLKPVKRRGNRRYYQQHEVVMIRRIRELLYDKGFTIQGARSRIQEWVAAERQSRRPQLNTEPATHAGYGDTLAAQAWNLSLDQPQGVAQLRSELVRIRDLLDPDL
ncbi:MAG: MerR family transcriptional regulator [Burkholderiaceae bacterium]